MSTFVNNNISQIALSTGTLGAAAGRTVITNGPLPGYVSSIIFVYTATATVGTRNVGIKIVDSSSNSVVLANNGFAHTAGLTENYMASGGAPNLATGGVITLSLPTPAYLPPNGKILVADSANIDVNDTVASGQAVIQY